MYTSIWAKVFTKVGRRRPLETTSKRLENSNSKKIYQSSAYNLSMIEVYSDFVTAN